MARASNNDEAERRALGYGHRRVTRRLLPFGLGLIAWLPGNPAAAAPQLTWQAPSDCPQGPAVLALVRDIVGEEVWGTTTLRAWGTITETPTGYRLELRTESGDESHVRTLDARACGDLLGASAVVLGLNLKGEAAAGGVDGASDSGSNTQGDSGGRGAAAASGDSTTGADSNNDRSGQGEAPKNADAANGRESAADSDDESPAAVRDSFWIGLPLVAVGIGSLPEPTWSGGLLVGSWFSDWSAWLAARYQLPQTLQSTSSDQVGAQVNRYGGELALSRHFRAGPMEFGPFVGFGVDYLTARGTGVDVVSARSGSFVSSAAVGFVARLSVANWVSLSGTLCGEVALARPRFVVDALGEVGQLGPFQGRFGLATEWKF